MLIGFALNGIAQGFIFIPLLPDALEAVFIKEDIIEGENEYMDQLISDYGSGLYGTFFSTGQILAPIVGSAIFEQIGYRQTTDLMTVVCLIWCVIFFIFNVGFTIFSNEREIKEKREAIENERLQQIKEEEEKFAEESKTRDKDSPDVQILETGDEEVEIIVDGKAVKVPAKKKPKKRLYSTDKSEDVMAFLERKRLQWNS